MTREHGFDERHGISGASRRTLAGVWRLVQSRAWDEAGNPLHPPYGDRPMGHIAFDGDRMLAVLCNGDANVPRGQREFSSYGGVFVFDGAQLTVSVDVASDPARIGGQQVREVVLAGDCMVLRPPLRSYRGVRQRRELVWRRIGD